MYLSITIIASFQINKHNFGIKLFAKDYSAIEQQS